MNLTITLALFPAIMALSSVSAALICAPFPVPSAQSLGHDSTQYKSRSLYAKLNNTINIDYYKADCKIAHQFCRLYP